MVPDGQYYYFSFQKENVNQKEIPYYIFYNLIKVPLLYRLVRITAFPALLSKETHGIMYLTIHL